MRAGKLTTIVEIYKKGVSRDSGFGDAPNWTLWRSVYAEVRSEKGGEQAPVDQVDDFDIRHVRFEYFEVWGPNQSDRITHDMTLQIDGEHHDIDQIHPDFSDRKKDVRVRAIRKPVRA